jgi:hypothetical protein
MQIVTQHSSMKPMAQVVQRPSEFVLVIRCIDRYCSRNIGLKCQVAARVSGAAEVHVDSICIYVTPT